MGTLDHPGCHPFAAQIGTQATCSPSPRRRPCSAWSCGDLAILHGENAWEDGTNFLVHPHFETHFSGGSTSWDKPSPRQLPWPKFQYHADCSDMTSACFRKYYLRSVAEKPVARLEGFCCTWDGGAWNIKGPADWILAILGYPGHCFQNGTAWSGPNWLPAKLTVLQWLGLKERVPALRCLWMKQLRGACASCHRWQ